MSRYTDEEKAAIMAEARANIARADELLQQRRDPLENVIPFVCRSRRRSERSRTPKSRA